MLGLTVGFGGVLVIMLDKLSGNSASLGMTLCLIAVAALAGATLYVGRMMSLNKNVVMIVGLQMLVGSITLFPFSLIFETWHILPFHCCSGIYCCSRLVRWLDLVVGPLFLLSSNQLMED